MKKPPIAVFSVTGKDFAPSQLRELSGMMRYTIMAVGGGLGDDDWLYRMIEGHSEPLEHIAIVPLPSIDTDGHFRHVALIGYDVIGQKDEELFDALVLGLESAALVDSRCGQKVGSVHAVPLSSLDGMRKFFDGKSKCWCSMTPVVLQQFDKRKHHRKTRPISRCIKLSTEELEDLDGLIIPHYEPILPNSLRPMDYQVGDYLSVWPRLHLEVHFKTEHRGPLLYGRGKYVGLGLMLPV